MIENGIDEDSKIFGIAADVNIPPSTWIHIIPLPTPLIPKGYYYE